MKPKTQLMLGREVMVLFIFLILWLVSIYGALSTFKPERTTAGFKFFSWVSGAVVIAYPLYAMGRVIAYLISKRNQQQGNISAQE